MLRHNSLKKGRTPSSWSNTPITLFYRLDRIIDTIYVHWSRNNRTLKRIIFGSVHRGPRLAQQLLPQSFWRISWLEGIVWPRRWRRHIISNNNNNNNKTSITFRELPLCAVSTVVVSGELNIITHIVERFQLRSLKSTGWELWRGAEERQRERASSNIFMRHNSQYWVQLERYLI